MDKILQPGLSFTAIAAIGMMCGNLALAGPPGGRQAPSGLQNIAQHTSVAQRLDLRAPSMALGDAQRSESFPSAHRQIAESDTMRLPALGNTTLSQNTMQDLARRVRHEGLPVARIFEGKSSLVHVGFNQKGKPGLWLVQKTH
jgi:hypothetical protein